MDDDYNQDALEINNDKINVSNIPISHIDPRLTRKIQKVPEIICYSHKHRMEKSINSQKLKMSINNLDNSVNSQSINNITQIDNYQNKTNIFYKKYLYNVSKLEDIFSKVEEINKKIEENEKNVQILTENLQNLKNEKDLKKSSIVNLLSEKESLEEIYKMKIYFIDQMRQEKSGQFLPEIKSQEQIDNREDDIIKEQISSSTFFEEKELPITSDEIKNSNQQKYIKQIISFINDILPQIKNEDDILNKIKDKINLSYSIFDSEISLSLKDNDINIINNFFVRISLYISNHSFGKHSEININKFLRYLLKINILDIELSQIMKFLNKKYKETKNEIKDQINILTKKNENLKDKKIMLDKQGEGLEQILKKNKETLLKKEEQRHKLITVNKNDLINTLENIRKIKLKKESLLKEKANQEMLNKNVNITKGNYIKKNIIKKNETNEPETGNKSMIVEKKNNSSKRIRSYGEIRKSELRSRGNISTRSMNDNKKDLSINNPQPYVTRVTITNQRFPSNDLSNKNIYTDIDNEEPKRDTLQNIIYNNYKNSGNHYDRKVYIINNINGQSILKKNNNSQINIKNPNYNNNTLNSANKHKQKAVKIKSFNLDKYQNKDIKYNKIDNYEGNTYKRDIRISEYNVMSEKLRNIPKNNRKIEFQ